MEIYLTEYVGRLKLTPKMPSYPAILRCFLELEFQLSDYTYTIFPLVHFVPSEYCNAEILATGLSHLGVLSVDYAHANYNYLIFSNIY